MYRLGTYETFSRKTKMRIPRYLNVRAELDVGRDGDDIFRVLFFSFANRTVRNNRIFVLRLCRRERYGYGKCRDVFRRRFRCRRAKYEVDVSWIDKT